jgi:hypothetical protein
LYAGLGQSGFYTTDVDIDRSTGLVKASRESSSSTADGMAANDTGLQTKFLYDRMGRLTFVDRAAGSWTKYTYVNASAAAPALVDIASGSGSVGKECERPSITVQPQSTTATSASLNVTATGATGYQWYRGVGSAASIIAGATLNHYDTGLLSESTGFWVRVSSSCGWTDSATATVTICAPPHIDVDAPDAVTSFGGPVTLSIQASGSDLGYQWFKGASGITSMPVIGAISNTLQITPTASSSYWVQLQNTCGTANSRATQITVTASPATVFTASALTTTSIKLDWSAIAGASKYEIEQTNQNSSGLAWHPVATLPPTATTYTQTTLTPDVTYLYRIRAADGAGIWSPYALDLATTSFFTDDGTNLIRAQDFTRLRTAINAVRACSALPPFAWTNAIQPGGSILAADINELRTQLNSARAALGLAPATNGTLSSADGIKKQHIDELRGGVR